MASCMAYRRGRVATLVSRLSRFWWIQGGGGGEQKGHEFPANRFDPTISIVSLGVDV